MKTPHSTLHRYNPETIVHANKLTAGSISEQSHKTGMTEGEPLIVMLDCLQKYAEAYKDRHQDNLAEDYVLGPQWLQAAQALRALLNGDGAIAMRRNITTDTKDNGCCEAMFWDALRMAGFEEKDLN